MFARKLTMEETKNFINNVDYNKTKNWMSWGELASKMGPDILHNKNLFLMSLSDNFFLTSSHNNLYLYKEGHEIYYFYFDHLISPLIEKQSLKEGHIQKLFKNVDFIQRAKNPIKCTNNEIRGAIFEITTHRGHTPSSSSYYTYSQLKSNFLSYERGTIPTFEFVKRVANALECSPTELLSKPTKYTLSMGAKDFIKEARKQGIRGLYKIARDSNIPLEKLNDVIILGTGKLDQHEISSLFNMNFSLPTLASFAKDEVDLIAITKTKFATLSHEDRKWYDQRKAMALLFEKYSLAEKALLLKETGLSLEDFNKKILLQGQNLTAKLASPHEKEWQAVLRALEAHNITEFHLVLMGRYSLNHKQMNELIQCEKILKKYTEGMSKNEIIKNITEKELYDFYLSLKQEWSNTHSGHITKDVIHNIITKVGLKKFIVLSSVILTSALKSVPAIAAEIVAEEVKDHLDQNAINAKKENRTVDVFINRLGSHLLKFLLLIPKGINGALSTPILENNAVSSVMTLPTRTLDNFFKAEGYSASIVNDWHDVLAWALNQIKRTEIRENWKNTYTAEMFKGCDLIANPNVVMEHTDQWNDGWTPLHAAMHFGEDLLVEYLLEQGAIPIKNDKGDYPYQVSLNELSSPSAACKDNYEKAKKLLELAYQDKLPLIQQMEKEREEIIKEEQKKIEEEKQKIAQAESARQQAMAAAQAEAARQQAIAEAMRQLAINTSLHQQAMQRGAANALALNAQMAANQAKLHHQYLSTQNLLKPVAPSPTLPTFNLAYHSEQFSWYKPTNSYLPNSSNSSLLGYANGRTGGPGLFAGYSSSVSSSTKAKSGNGLEITINCSNHPESPAQFRCPKK